MENDTYVISWRAKLRASSGQGKKRFTRDEGERLAQKLNRDYPNFIHEAVEVLSGNESQAQFRADGSPIIRDTDFNPLPDKEPTLPLAFNAAA